MERVRAFKRTCLSLRVPLLLMLSLVLLSSVAFSQGGTATLLGTVSDNTGAAVPNAKITITNMDNGFIRYAESNSTGNYTATTLPIGKYQVKAEAAGFKMYQESGIVLNVNATVRTNVILEVGAVKESVTVEANALQVQTDTNEVSQTVTDTQITNLATNGRNVLQLTALVPGAASMMPDFDVPVAQYQNRNVNFNGQRSDHNNWIIDGGEAYDRGGGGILIISPSQDMIQEFKVTTSNYSADLGNASGGMITMAMKQGTKQYHGSAWEYNRNDALNAYNWLSKFQATPEKPAQMKKLRYNTFGFNIGGPVKIPGLVSGKKTFFFYNMEWRRYISGDDTINTATPSGRNFLGNMGQSGNGDYLGAIHVPNKLSATELAKYTALGLSAGQAFPNNTIPSSLINANAKAFLATGNFPSSPDVTGGNYYKIANTVDMYREEAVRLDHQFNDKLTVMGHLIWDSGTEQKPRPLWGGTTFPTLGSNATVPSWAGVMHVTYSISPTLLNEASFNTNGNNLTIVPSGNWKIPAGWNVKQLFPGVNTDNKMPTINVTTPYGIQFDPARWPWNNTWRSYQWKDDISWSHGTHNIRFGAAYMYTKKYQPTDQNIGGNFQFNGTATGAGLADFLLGYAASFQQPSYRTAVNIANHTINLYAQDDWRVTKRLTLNLGLRWEWLPHAYDQNNQLSNFFPELYDPAQAPTFIGGNLDPNGPGFRKVPGTPLQNTSFYLNGVAMAGAGIPKGLTDNTWKTFAPRVGFAYDLTGNGNTVLRGGFGMFYERVAGNEQYNEMNNVPFVFQPTVNYVLLDNPSVGYQDGATINANDPNAPRGVTSITGVMKRYPIPTTLQFNLGIQQGLKGKAVLSVAYVGNTAYHQSFRREVNNVRSDDTASRLLVCGGTCTPGAASVSANPYRPYKGFANIQLADPSGTSNYNSLQVSMRTTSWKDLTVSGTWTWAHGFDLNDGDNFNPVNNSTDLRYNYGPTGYDRRQVANITYIYNLPFFRKSDSHMAKALLGGWTLSGVTSFQSGNPLTVNASGNDVLGLGGDTTNLANRLSTVTYSKSATKWFSTESFANPGPLQWGNGRRGSVIGPGRNNWNMALYKNFQFGERAGFEFRAESFNTFNHTQYTGLNMNYGQLGNKNGFGWVNAATDGRAFQLGAKLSF